MCLVQVGLLDHSHLNFDAENGRREWRAWKVARSAATASLTLRRMPKAPPNPAAMRSRGRRLGGPAHTQTPVLPAMRPVLLWSVRVCLALTLLTPLIVTTDTYFPFVVGKAVYVRFVIELAACFWVALVLLDSSWRPPRSPLLVVMALGLACHLLAAWFGVSPVRSMWSTYERMQGFVDAAHWFAFAVITVSVLRDAASMRALLNANLGVALAVGCLAIIGYFVGEVPFYGTAERDAPRIGSVFGNAIYLAIYAMINLFLALGFLAHSFVTGRDASPTNRSRRWRRAIALRVFWGATAAVSVLAVAYSGSFTVLAALVGGIGLLAITCAFFWRSPFARLFAIVASVLGAGGTAVFLFPGAFPVITEQTFDHPLLQRLADSNIRHSSFVNRRLAWEAGLKGFADKPVLGWGPGNYIVVFGKHFTSSAEYTDPHDHAHNKIIEEAATKGVLGLATYLALWVIAFRIVFRSAKRAPNGERVFTLVLGAAMAAYFLQSLTLFDTVSLNLQFVLLLAYVITLETALRREPPKTSPGIWRSWTARPAVRHAGKVVFGCGVLALAASGMALNHATFTAATAIADTGAMTAKRPFAHLEQAQAIRDCPPLANGPRMQLFMELAQVWRPLRIHRGAEAQRLLEQARLEGALAMSVEPENWEIPATLANLYAEAGPHRTRLRRARRTRKPKGASASAEFDDVPALASALLLANAPVKSGRAPYAAGRIIAASLGATSSGRSRSTSPPVRRRYSTTPSLSPRSPTVTRCGMPMRSASANFTPGRSSRSSSSVSRPAASSASCKVAAVRLTADDRTLLSATR